MQYPELNVGEFASRHSANVELEKHEDEEGYLLMVDVEPHEGEEGYPVSIGARPQTVEEVGELYENQFANISSDDLVTVYGNDEDAILSMRGSDVWARFEAPAETESATEESYELKGWAVDIEPLIRGMDERMYQEVADEISASTLYVINRAESEGEVGTGLQDFHRDIIREFRPGTGDEPIEIDVVEESERSSEYVDIPGEKSGARNEEDLLERSTDDITQGSSSTHVSEEVGGAETEMEIDYEELVSGTISESKNRIEELEDELDTEDWEALLEAERQGEDRVTFKPYLEERLEEEREE